MQSRMKINEADKTTAKRRLPPWIRVRLSYNENSCNVQNALNAGRLHTVCESARCPNRPECFGAGTATVMILGDICTRNCRFCAVKSGSPNPPDTDEPKRVFDLAKKLRLSHVVITSVTRDDLSDGGAQIFAESISRLKSIARITIEVLTPDFQERASSLKLVMNSQPDVFNHNLETVKRLQSVIRPQASYERSLNVLRMAAEYGGKTRIKSGLMAGLGETDDELFESFKDLFQAGCRFLTIGQYLAPSKEHLPVHRYIEPSVFEEYKKKALAIGFAMVMAGPLVRSSYHAKIMADKKPS